MSKFWIRFWWGFTFLGLLGMLVFWLLPEPVSEGDATPDEREQVVSRVKEANTEFDYLKFTQVKAHGNRVVEVNANWTGAGAPPTKDRQAWGQVADQVAQGIARDYIPEGWQVNVALWYKRLPRGIAGRTAGANSEGGPAHLYRDKEALPPV